jgi:hypothetical protein
MMSSFLFLYFIIVFDKEGMNHIDFFFLNIY